MAKTHKHTHSIAIPDFWTADEALGFVAFLQQLISATWAAHGDDMAESLRRIGHAEPTIPTAIREQLDEDLGLQSKFPF